MSDGIMIIGLLIIFIGTIFLLIEAFRENAIWGIVCLFITPAFLAFIIFHWGVSKKPVNIQFAGLFAMIVGVFIGNTG